LNFVIERISRIKDVTAVNRVIPGKQGTRG